MTLQVQDSKDDGPVGAAIKITQRSSVEVKGSYLKFYRGIVSLVLKGSS